MSDAIFERVAGFYDADTLVELTAVIAFENASARFNAALGVRSQELWDRSRTSAT